jgi:protein SCO1
MATDTQAIPQAVPNWTRRWIIAGGIFAAVLVLGALAFKIFQPVQVLPRIRLAPGFALYDQDGKRVTNEDLRGQIVLYNFAYAHCPEPACAASNQVMAEIQRRLGEVDTGGAPVKLVTVSVDPEHDLPAALKTYAASQGADPQIWRFVTARDPALLKTIVGSGFEVFYQDQPGGEIKLDPAFILVDGWGIIRGEYRYATLSPDADRILRHLNVLGQEIKYSTGPNRLAYEAAHLFLCYSH